MGHKLIPLKLTAWYRVFLDMLILRWTKEITCANLRSSRRWRFKSTWRNYLF